jgi:hypothetical protein
MTSSPTNASPLRQRTTDDMRMRQGFKGTVQPTRTLEAKQQPAELVLQGKHTLDGTEPLCEDGRVGQRLAPSPGSPSTVRVSADAAVGLPMASLRPSRSGRLFVYCQSGRGYRCSHAVHADLPCGAYFEGGKKPSR